MKLKEQFAKLDSEFDGVSIFCHNDEECKKIADSYAEAFGKWLRENNDESLTMSKLLEFFYNEKGL